MVTVVEALTVAVDNTVLLPELDTVDETVLDPLDEIESDADVETELVAVENTVLEAETSAVLEAEELTVDDSEFEPVELPDVVADVEALMVADDESVLLPVLVCVALSVEDCVLEGDVISQPKNVPDLCRSVTSVRASRYSRHSARSTPVM